MVFFNRTTSSTNYAPPTVTGIFQADGVTLITDASANGDETIVLLGKNFGPVGTVQIWSTRPTVCCYRLRDNSRINTNGV